MGFCLRHNECERTKAIAGLELQFERVQYSNTNYRGPVTENHINFRENERDAIKLATNLATNLAC